MPLALGPLQVSQCTLGRRALGDSVVPSNSMECSLPKDLHHHADTSSIGQFLRFAVNKRTALDQHVHNSVSQSLHSPKLGRLRFQFQQLPDRRFRHGTAELLDLRPHYLLVYTPHRVQGHPRVEEYRTSDRLEQIPQRLWHFHVFRLIRLVLQDQVALEVEQSNE